MAEKIRIGFVGVGGMGQCAHLQNYVLNPECVVSGIAEVRENHAQLVASRYGIEKVFKTPAEMLSEMDLDGIVASQQFQRHGLILDELLKYGKPIFIEKPLAGSLETGKAIIEKLQKSKSFVMVGYHKRSDPATEYAKKEIDRLKETKELGELTYVRILMPAGDWVANGFRRMLKGNDPKIALARDPLPADMDAATYKRYDGFVNYYIHQVNLMRHLLGEPYQVKYADPKGVLLVGMSESGLPCTIEMTPYSTTVDWQESALVAFEHGYVKLELPAPMAYNRAGQVEIFRDPGNGIIPKTEIPQMPWVHAMYRQSENFIRAIKGEIKPPCDAAEALEDLKVATEYVTLRDGVMQNKSSKIAK